MSSTKYPVVSFSAQPGSAVASGPEPLALAKAPLALPAAANTTLTAATVLDAVLDNSAATAVNTVTLPTAALLVAGLSGAIVGSSFCFNVVGDAGSNLNVAPGTGGTLSGSGVVLAATSAKYQVRLTNVSSGTEAYTLTRLA